MWWVTLEDFDEDTIILVLASSQYREKDYIREPNEFFIEKPYPVSRPEE